MIASAQPDADRRHQRFLESAVTVLERLAEASGAQVENSAARRALVDAMHAWPGDERDLWWKWLREAGASLGIRVRVIDGSLKHATDLARFGARIAVWVPEPRPVFAVLTGVRGRKIYAAFPPEEIRPQKLRQRTLAERLNTAGRAEPIRFILTEPGASHPVTQADEHGAAISPLSRLWMLLRPEWPDLWIILTFALFVGLLALATPIAVEALVNTVAFGQLLQPVVVLALMLFVFLMFAACIRLLQTYVVEIIQRRLFARVAGDLAWRLPRVRADAYDRAYGPELVNRFFDVVMVQKAAALLLLDGIAIVIGTLVGMAVLAFYHPWLLGFDIFLLALIAFLVFVLGRGAVASSIKESKAKYYMAGWLEELARCPITFKIDGAAEFASERADRMVSDYLTARGKHFRVLIRQIGFALFLQALASTILLGLGGWLVVKGQLTLGQLVAAELIVAIVVGSFAKLGKHMEVFYDLLASVDKLGHLFDLPLERQHGLARVDGRGAAALELKHVAYHFPDEAALIRGLTLKLRPGERFGVTGPPGVGKSTLLDLLYGLRSADHGHVQLDGTDLRDLRPDVLRQHVALARSVEIFHGTLAENVHLQRSGVTISDVRDALARVGLLDETLALPDGLNTELSSTGGPLSSSQQRRLMLARALAGRPRLLLIDGLLDELPDDLVDSIQPVVHSDSSYTLVIASGRERVLETCDRVLHLPQGDLETQFAVPGE